MIKKFEDIDAYKRARSLYPRVVSITQGFPSQGWHLRDQLCRSANSIPSNIAEGYGRSIPEFKLYLTRALGSCNETLSHLKNAIDVEWIDPTDGEKLLSEYTIVGKQIFRLRENWS